MNDAVSLPSALVGINEFRGDPYQPHHLVQRPQWCSSFMFRKLIDTLKGDSPVGLLQQRQQRIEKCALK